MITWGESIWIKLRRIHINDRMREKKFKIFFSGRFFFYPPTRVFDRPATRNKLFPKVALIKEKKMCLFAKSVWGRNTGQKNAISTWKAIPTYSHFLNFNEVLNKWEKGESRRGSPQCPNAFFIRCYSEQSLWDKTKINIYFWLNVLLFRSFSRQIWKLSNSNHPLHMYNIMTYTIHK